VFISCLPWPKSYFSASNQVMQMDWGKKFTPDFPVYILTFMLKMTLAKYLKAKKKLRKFLWIPLHREDQKGKKAWRVRRI